MSEGSRGPGRREDSGLAALIAGDAETARRHAVEEIVDAERVVKATLLATSSIRSATVMARGRDEATEL
jgi:hypothetical protein